MKYEVHNAGKIKMGLGYIGRILPHVRTVYETDAEISSALVRRSEDDEDEDFVYKDEAKRKFWDFFDEFEYRKNKPAKFKYLFTKSRSELERKLLLKLDIMITFYGFLGILGKVFGFCKLEQCVCFRYEGRPWYGAE